MNRSALIVAVLALATVSGSAAAGNSPAPAKAASVRHPEEGRPFIRAYQPLEIGGGSQTWAILQDRRGVMYFGTNGAILVFDGANWRRIAIAASGGNSIRGMVEDADGRDLGRIALHIRLSVRH